MSYLACELHCHTKHSDGGFEVNELQKSAKENGLSLIALTDHNTKSGCNELDDSIIPTIRGIEWTTYFGHMLVLGAKKFVDWRDAVPDNIDTKTQSVKESGGVIGIAHPKQFGSPMCTGGRWEFNVNKWESIDYVEIWHDSFGSQNYENAPAVIFWNSLLDKGYKLAATYGRDWHSNKKQGEFGCTYLKFDSAPCEEDALNALRLGRSVVSTGPKFFFRVHRMLKTFEIGDSIKPGNVVFSFFTDLHTRESVEERLEKPVIKIVTNGGKTIVEAAADERHIHLEIKKGCWYRAELWCKENGLSKPLAITSPVYCE